MLPIKSIVAAAMVLSLMSGCAGTDPSIIGKATVVLKEHKSFMEGKFLKVVATFVNKDDKSAEGMVYQVEWIDDKGVVKDRSSWKPLTIIGNQQIQVVEMTNLPNIVDYKILISTPNK